MGLDQLYLGNQREELIKQVRRARSTVRLVSPWLHVAPVREVQRALPLGVSLQVVFKWPTAGDLRGSLDLDALDALLDWRRREGARIEIGMVQNLHAKVYLVGDWGMLGSANLTRPGMGLPGGWIQDQVEACLAVPPSVAQHLHVWLDDLVPTALEAEHLTSFRACARELQALPEDDAPLVLLSRPGPPPGEQVESPSAGPVRGTPSEAVRAALERGEARGLFGDRKRTQLHGLRHMWRMKVSGIRARTWKGSVSGPDAQGYHFDVRRAHLRYFRSRKLTGLLLVPTTAGTFTRSAPVALIEVNRLRDEKGLTEAALSSVSVMRRATVRRVDGQWWFAMSATGDGSGPRVAHLDPVADGFVRLGRWLDDAAEVRRLAGSAHEVEG